MARLVLALARCQAPFVASYHNCGKVADTHTNRHKSDNTTCCKGRTPIGCLCVGDAGSRTDSGTVVVPLEHVEVASHGDEQLKLATRAKIACNKMATDMQERHQR